MIAENSNNLCSFSGYLGLVEYWYFDVRIADFGVEILFVIFDFVKLILRLMLDDFVKLILWFRNSICDVR